MKRIFFTLAAALLTLCFTAQNTFNRAYHSQNEITNPFLFEINSDIYFTSQSIDAANFGAIYLYSHNAGGNLQFRKYLNLPASPVVGFKTLDNKFVVAGGRQVCDVFYSTQTDYLYKYDALGNAVFQATFTSFAYDDLKAVVQGYDSAFYVFTDSLFLKFSKNGQLVFNNYSGLTEVKSAIILPNNSILVSARGVAGPALQTFSTNGVFMSAVSTPVMFNKLSLYGGQKILALGNNGKLYKYSPALSLIGSNTTSATPVIHDVVCNSDTIYAIQSSSSAPALYHVCDTSFTGISTSSTSTNKVTQTGVFYTSLNKVAILSDVASTLNQPLITTIRHLSASLSVINKFSSNNFVNDLALTNIHKDSCFFVPGGPPNNPSFYLANLRAKVTVKNTGSTTINSFKLNCFTYPGVACGASYWQETFSQLNLQPGDSVTVRSASYAQQISSPSFIGGNVSADFCFYVTLPDNQTDKTLADNELCKTINVLINYVEQLDKAKTRVLIFPNPFGNWLITDSNDEIKSIKLINSLGEVVLEQHSADTRCEIDVQKLSPGAYIAEITLNGILVRKKMIKQ